MIGAPHGTTRPRHATFGAAAALGWWRCLSRLGLRPWCCRSARHPSAPGGSPWRRSSAPVVDLPDHQGDLQCRARVARFSAPFFSVLPDLFVAGDDTRPPGGGGRGFESLPPAASLVRT